MKTQATLLAAYLLSVGYASAQGTTGSTTTGSATTNATTGTSTGMTGSGTGTSSTTPAGSATSGSMMDNRTGTTGNGALTNGTITTTADTYNANTRPERTKLDYKNFVFGIYGGLNTTKFKGESVNAGGKLSGRLGYQAGFFVRGGGRLYGQLGAEYFASSSNYFVAGSGQTAKNIQSQIDIQYVQIPVYIGYKLVESDRGISAVRLQVGLEYANRINANSGDFNLSKNEIKSGTFNGLGQLGFDAGPIFLDFTYHHGFNNAINSTNVGFAGSQRRILSASVGFKF
ncbi:MAG TPA: hypothetical protein VK404_11765 [Spirosoma sp.]|nr:hypothetical protein [Spirosoma sp.]